MAQAEVGARALRAKAELRSALLAGGSACPTRRRSRQQEKASLADARGSDQSEARKQKSSGYRLNYGDRADGGAGGAHDLQGRGDEGELVLFGGGQFFEIQALDDVNAAFDEQVNVNGH